MSALQAKASVYSVGVRALCEFAARTGSINRRASASPSSAEGIAGHQAVVGSRRGLYEAEVYLEGEYLAAGPPATSLRVLGRADGFDSSTGRLEEIKTHRGPVEAIDPDLQELHWAQARVYGHLICLQRDLAEVEIALVYYNVDTQTESVLTEQRSADELRQRFGSLCEIFGLWAGREANHRRQRDLSLEALRFPYPDFRKGQRTLANAVFNAHRRACALLAQAPTGIGKSLATVYPALKGIARQRIDKLFYLTAKTPGRATALDAWGQIRTANPDACFRVIELVAREKSCEYPDRLCQGSSCPLARGFYDRLPAARDEAVGLELLDKASVRALALRHEVCPYYLSQALMPWADLIVGDYNHYFDFGAGLASQAASNDWSISVLVDEAHNLVERARSMFTASLASGDFRALSGASAPVVQAGQRVAGVLESLTREQEGGNETAYAELAEVPRPLLEALQAYIGAMSDVLAHASRTVRTRADDLLLQRYFDALKFCRMAEDFAEHSVCDLSLTDTDSASACAASGYTICIRNIVPAFFLRPRFEAARTTTLFSATVSPAQYVIDMLGLPDSVVCVDVPAPFSADQLNLRLITSVPTRWSRRRESVEPICQLVAEQLEAHPGNYLLYTSSFEYLGQLAQAIERRCPGLSLVRQAPGMSEPERDAFIARFQPGSQQIGLAVLGGVFAEGIDLPGARLLGVFVVTLGLPRIDAIGEVFRARCEALYGAGFEYAYLYPGMQRVVQAAGRVIRTPEDRGHVFLIDERIAQPVVRQLLPLWWTDENRLAKDTLVK